MVVEHYGNVNSLSYAHATWSIYQDYHCCHHRLQCGYYYDHYYTLSSTVCTARVDEVTSHGFVFKKRPLFLDGVQTTKRCTILSHTVTYRHWRDVTCRVSSASTKYPLFSRRDLTQRDFSMGVQYRHIRFVRSLSLIFTNVYLHDRSECRWKYL